MKHMWDKETQTHLKEHVKWPATGKEVLEACNLMAHVPEADRMMAKQKLDPTKTYGSVEEAMMDMNR
ncbi:MAG TPA: hypothetical protein VGR25_08805 [bacterium]|nr:hypothetical protein [bacterium]